MSSVGSDSGMTSVSAVSPQPNAMPAAMYAINEYFI
jgi:hypothetical protein